MFEVLKGVFDGVLSVPDLTTRFSRFKKSEYVKTYDPKIHIDIIFGADFDKLITKLKDKSEDSYKK